MSGKIEGSVAKILNARELVINRGSNHGVVLGMRFAVLDKNGMDITDPDTGEPLGSVEVVKTLVKATKVYETVTVARTFRVFSSEATGFYRSFTPGILGTPGHSETETLRTNETYAYDELSESQSFVRRGDPVVQATGDEYDSGAED